jgi:hypothetical protein
VGRRGKGRRAAPSRPSGRASEGAAAGLPGAGGAGAAAGIGATLTAMVRTPGLIVVQIARIRSA